jgi:hypothetical protein
MREFNINGLLYIAAGWEINQESPVKMIFDATSEND